MILGRFWGGRRRSWGGRRRSLWGAKAVPCWCLGAFWVPLGTKMAPRPLQDPSQSHLGSILWPQEAPSWSQEGPKTAQEALKRPIWDPLGGQLGPENGPLDPPKCPQKLGGNVSRGSPSRQCFHHPAQARWRGSPSGSWIELYILVQTYM